TGNQFVAIVSIRMTNRGIASFGGSHMVVLPPSFSLCAPLPSRQHWPRGPSSRPDDLGGGGTGRVETHDGFQRVDELQRSGKVVREHCCPRRQGIQASNPAAQARRTAEGAGRSGARGVEVLGADAGKQQAEGEKRPAGEEDRIEAAPEADQGVKGVHGPGGGEYVGRAPEPAGNHLARPPTA